MTPADREAPVIEASSLDTAWLVQLALTLPVSASARNELYGRDRAYWAIGHGHDAARRWIHAQPEPEQRRAAARALALAGHQLADLGRIPAGISLAALAAWDGGVPADRGASYFILAQAQPGRTVPVVAENVGPYGSLEAALADNPGFHEASEAEYGAYLEYWKNRD